MSQKVVRSVSIKSMTQAITSLNMRSKNHGVGYMPLRQILKVKQVDWTLLDDVIDDIVKMFRLLQLKTLLKMQATVFMV